MLMTPPAGLEPSYEWRSLPQPLFFLPSFQCFFLPNATDEEILNEARAK
jgi:hypothetical protein